MPIENYLNLFSFYSFFPFFSLLFSSFRHFPRFVTFVNKCKINLYFTYLSLFHIPLVPAFRCSILWDNLRSIWSFLLNSHCTCIKSFYFDNTSFRHFLIQFRNFRWSFCLDKTSLCHFLLRNFIGIFCFNKSAIFDTIFRSFVKNIISFSPKAFDKAIRVRSIG